MKTSLRLEQKSATKVAPFLQSAIRKYHRHSSDASVKKVSNLYSSATTNSMFQLTQIILPNRFIEQKFATPSKGTEG